MPRSLWLILSALVAALLGIATNVATGILPRGWTPHLWLAWPASGVLITAVIALEVISQRRADEPIGTNPAQARRILVNRVRLYWIEGVLDKSLYYEARIELGLQAIVGGRIHPWDIVGRRSDNSVIQYPPDRTIKSIFEELDTPMAILGDPGSGKTTMLLELARSLLESATADDSAQVPVILPLSSWATRRQPIAEWIADQLVTQYRIPRQLATKWVAEQEIIPLFDGLDEVAHEYRDKCATALADYVRDYSLTPSALCCRKSEFNLLRQRPGFERVLLIQALTREQIERYFDSAGNGLTGLRSALASDPALWDLAESPLLLSIMALAYRQNDGSPPADGLSDRRQELYAHYVRTMLIRRTDQRYAPAQSVKYLAVLAEQLQRLEQTVFTLDLVNSLWSKSYSNRDLQARSICSLASGVMFFALGWLFSSLVCGLMSGLFGLVYTTAIAAGSEYEDLLFISIGAREQYASRSKMAVTFTDWLMDWTFGVADQLKESLQRPATLWCIVASCAISGLVLAVTSTATIAFAYAGGLAISTLIGFGVSREAIFSADDAQPVSRPGRREIPSLMLQTRLNFAIKVAVVAGVTCGLISWAVGRLAPASALLPTRFGVLVGVLIAVVVVVAVAVAPIVEQLLTRWALTREDTVPYPYFSFLDFMTNCLLLRQVGSGYIFVHREVMEFMAGRYADGQTSHVL